MACAGSTNYLPRGDLLACAGSARRPETNESGCLGPGLGPGPPWGPRGPPWGPMPTHTPRCPGFGPDEFRWPLRTTICMAKEMWFLRLLLEWPGFATLSYSVIQCTAAVPLPGTWFLQESLFWENIIYFANIQRSGRRVVTILSSAMVSNVGWTIMARMGGPWGPMGPPWAPHGPHGGPHGPPW